MVPDMIASLLILGFVDTKKHVDGSGKRQEIIA